MSFVVQTPDRGTQKEERVFDSSKPRRKKKTTSTAEVNETSVLLHIICQLLDVGIDHDSPLIGLVLILHLLKT
jgi:hypothetical protein